MTIEQEAEKLAGNILDTLTRFAAFDAFSDTQLSGTEFNEKRIKLIAEKALPLLQKLEVAEEALGKYADEENWKQFYEDDTSNHKDIWCGDENGYEPAKTALEAMKAI